MSPSSGDQTTEPPEDPAGGLGEIVSVSPYPRPGYPIAPLALAPILDVPLPDDARARVPAALRDATLADLDDTIWLRVDPDICRALADAVVAQVVRRFRNLPADVLERELESPLVGGSRAARITFSSRTRNALDRSGLLERWCGGETVTIGDLVTASPRLGPRSLVDGFGGHERALLATLDQPAGPGIDIDTEMRRVALRAVRNPRASEVAMADPRLMPLWFIQIYTRRDRIGDMTLDDYSRRVLKAEHHLKDYPLPAFDQYRLEEDAARQFIGLTLEEELEQVARLAAGEKNAPMFIAHHGWDGGGSRSLREVAEIAGMSHERVRQLSTEIAGRFPRRPIFAPTLERAIDFVADAAPDDAASISERLRDAGVTEGLFALSGLLDAAVVLGRTAPWDVEPSSTGAEIVTTSRERVRAHRILGLAHAAMLERGFYTISSLVEALVPRGEIPRAEVTRTLVAHPHIRWLDSEHETFWLADSPRNALVSAIFKTVAVHSPQESCELREAIKRSSLLRAGTPPSALIIEICRQLPQLEVDPSGRLVYARDPESLETELSPNEWVMAHLLREQGSVVSRSRYRELCVRAGVVRGSFSFYLDVLPFLEELERGIYTIRGAEPDPRLVEATIATTLGL